MHDILDKKIIVYGLYRKISYHDKAVINDYKSLICKLQTIVGNIIDL